MSTDDARGLDGRLRRRLPKGLLHRVPVDRAESEVVLRHRRRVVAAVTVAGAGMLGRSLSTPPGSRSFYVSSLGVAGIWCAGSLFSGPVYRGWIQRQDETIHRPVLVPVGTGVIAFGCFYGAALAARRVPVLEQALVRVLRYADQGTGPLVLATVLANGVAEEIFFRGALYAALDDWHAVPASTAVYAVATAATRNPALILASTAMGALFALQRRASGGIQAPVLTHLTWSVLMVRLLPPLFRDRKDA